jgi:sugar phosphate isomerase/epimerase
MNIGAQLYTLRDHCKTPGAFDETMRRVAEIGYKSVQISGIGGISAAAIRETAGKYGLAIPLTHASPQRIRDDTAAVIEEHRIMGAAYIGMGMMPDEYRGDAAGISRFIADYLPAADQIASAGMKLMYHNHSFEYERFAGELIMDRLAEGFSPREMGFTLDTYWVAHGGGDPAFWLKKLSGRVDTVHYKDMKIAGGGQRMAEVLEGNLNWEAIFEASRDAGVKWAFVEQDDCYGEDPFGCLALSFKNLSRAMRGS